MSDSNKPPAPSPEQIFAQFGDLFGDFFGGKLGGRGNHALRVELALTDEEARDGVTKTVTFDRPVTCETCKGAGGTSPPVPCKACNGAGHKQHAQGFFMLQTACADCKGAGAIHADPCADCEGGATLVTEKASVEVVVPPNSQHGQMLMIGMDRPKLLYVELVVGGRPTQMELAMRAISPEPIPSARLVPSREERKTQLLTLAAFVIIVAFAIALMR